MKNRVVIVGGGWAGCSAAMTARLAGADEVIVLERSDGLLGTGLVGGIMRNNGRYTAAEEMIALGAGHLFQACDATARHRNLDFPGHKDASLYDVAMIEPAARRCLLEHGIEIWLISRVTGIDRSNGSIAAVRLENGTRIEGDMFVDATGTVGSQSFCTEYGNGCVMCIVRCPTFGPRVSLTGLAGIPERQGQKADGTIGAMSGSCKLNKDTVAPHVREALEQTGQCILPMPQPLAISPCTVPTVRRLARTCRRGGNEKRWLYDDLYCRLPLACRCSAQHCATSESPSRISKPAYRRANSHRRNARRLQPALLRAKRETRRRTCRTRRYPATHRRII